MPHTLSGLATDMGTAVPAAHTIAGSRVVTGTAAVITGSSVGDVDGTFDGDAEGTAVGTAVGVALGTFDGLVVGDGVGASVSATPTVNVPRCTVSLSSSLFAALWATHATAVHALSATIFGRFAGSYSVLPAPHGFAALMPLHVAKPPSFRKQMPHSSSG